MSGNMGMKGPTGQSGNKIPKGYKQFQLQNMTPEQMQLFSQAMEQMGPESFLARLAAGDESMFQELEAPAMKQFSGLQGGLASRFSGMGMGGRKSSGFQNTMNQASSDFASQLQSQRMDLQRNAISDMQNFTNQLLNQKPYETGLVKKQQKQGVDWGGLAGATVGGVGGFFAGGPMGAMTGASMGYGIGSGKGGGSNYQSSPNWDYGNWSANNLGM